MLDVGGETMGKRTLILATVTAVLFLGACSQGTPDTNDSQTLSDMIVDSQEKGEIGEGS